MTFTLFLYSYLDTQNEGWVEVADYERLLELLGFDTSSPDPGGGRAKEGGGGGGGGGKGGGGGAATQVTRIGDPHLETLMLLASPVNFEEFFRVLVDNDFPDEERGGGGGGKEGEGEERIEALTGKRKKCCCSIM